MDGSAKWLSGMAALALAATVQAGEEAAPTQPTVVVDLTDGSRIIGTTDTRSVGVRTSYAKMDIALAKILSIKMKDDKETASLTMVSGDSLKGFLDMASIGLKTSFGNVSIKAEHIRGIQVRPDAKAVIEGLKRGLIVYLPFDKDEGPKTTNAGQLEGCGDVRGARWIREGKKGGAYNFNGASDLIELAACDSLGITNAMSACAWIRRQDRAIVVLSNYRGGESYSGQFFFGIDGAGVIDVAFGQAPGQCIRYRSADADIVPANEWHHIAFSYDESRGQGKKIRIYLDGKDIGKYFIQREGTGGPVLAISDRLRVMAHIDEGPGGFFKGAVDEVMIFNRALSDEEVAALYRSQE